MSVWWCEMVQVICKIMKFVFLFFFFIFFIFAIFPNCKSDIFFCSSSFFVVAFFCSFIWESCCRLSTCAIDVDATNCRMCAAAKPISRWNCYDTELTLNMQLLLPSSCISHDFILSFFFRFDLKSRILIYKTDWNLIKTKKKRAVG